MAQPPTFDLATHSYSGVVRHRFSCPVYTEPYPFGSRLTVTFNSGESVGDLLEFRLSDDGEYFSARTHLGWINVWVLRNRFGRPTGVYFVVVTGRPRETMLPAAAQPAPPEAAPENDAA